MDVQFWGTRGSLPKPGPTTLRYGGNTSCVEVRSARGTLIIIDCGTGLHDLGHSLMAKRTGPLNGHVFISHTHWDHIQGIPFFAPFFAPGNAWHIYGPRGLDQSLRETLAGQMQHTYFPVAPEQFGATISYHDLLEGKFEIDDVKVTTKYLNHPALTLGYRLEADGATLTYCCDHEPYSRSVADGEADFAGQDERHAEFVEGSDLLIHDAQYTAAEYPAKVGWGHSSGEFVVRVARRARVKAVALTHHDPLRSDDALDAIIERLRAGSPQPSPTIFAAAERQTLSLQSSGPCASPRTTDGVDALEAKRVALADRSVALNAVDSEIGRSLAQAAEAEGMRVDFFSDAETIAKSRPSLVMVQHCATRRDGTDLCRAIRDAHGDDIPLVVVADRDQAASALSEAASDWLIAPFSESYARTKMRAWVLRAACRWMRPPEPADEQERVASLQALRLLDREPDERFDRIARLAAACVNAPMSTITLIDINRQWFLSRVGMSDHENPRDVSFCAHVVYERKPIIVADTLLDDRFADNPLVLGKPRIRFYAGFPLILKNGRCVGTLCILDTRPRALQPPELTLLRDLAALALHEINISAEAA